MEEIKRLKGQAGPLLQVHGSWQLIQNLFENDLVDELRLWTFPVVIGSGKRLFGEGSVPKKYALTKSGITSSGVVMTFYERVAKAPLA